MDTAVAARELRPKNPIDLVNQINAPVLGLYGGADQGIPVAQIEQMRAALKAAGKRSEIVIYPDTPHGFNADYRPSYRPRPRPKTAGSECRPGSKKTASRDFFSSLRSTSANWSRVRLTSVVTTQTWIGIPIRQHFD